MPHRWYYSDERKADEAPEYAVDGDAYGEVYTSLAEQSSHGPWLVTFVTGQGYVDSEEKTA